jgi:hypothetical protein
MDIKALNLSDEEECQSVNAEVNFTRIYLSKDEEYCILFKEPFRTAQ